MEKETFCLYRHTHTHKYMCVYVHITTYINQQNRAQRVTELILISTKIPNKLLSYPFLSTLEIIKMIANSHSGFVKNKSCQTNATSFFYRVTGLVEKGKENMQHILTFVKTVTHF